MDNAIGFPHTYPLDSDLTVDSAIQHLNNRGQLFSDLFLQSSKPTCF